METLRMRLTIITLRDYQELLDMYAEEDTFKYIQPLQNKTREEFVPIMDFRREQAANGLGHYWVARLNTTDELVGALNLNPFRETGRIQLGYQIRKKFWGQGFATEMTQAGIRFGFQDWKLKRIHAFVDKKHEASRNILRKIGFQILDAAFKLENEPPLEMYGIDQE